MTPMNSIWSNLYDKAKDRRYGLLFFFSLIGLFGVFLSAMLAWQMVQGLELLSLPWKSQILLMLPGPLIIVAAIILRAIRRVRARHRTTYRREALSRDELCKARSKLRVNKTGLYSKR